MIAGLEILNLHAQGGMAEVYRARGKGADGSDYLYAVKRILPEYTRDPEIKKMFIEEARVAACLIHPNVVRVYDLATTENEDLFIVMEFLEGKDLSEAIEEATNRKKPLPIWFALQIAKEVLRALQYVTLEATDRNGRNLGLIHRDISPHNIFLCFDGQVKLTDFGVAKAQESNVKTQIGITKGKLGYMSPEQLMGTPLDFRSDLYNVGILLFEMITGKQLFAGQTTAEFLQAMVRGIVPPMPASAQAPPELEALLRRCLERDRNKRPPSAVAFERELDQIANSYNLTAQAAHVSHHLKELYGKPEAARVAKPAHLLQKLKSMKLEVLPDPQVAPVQNARPITQQQAAQPQAAQPQAAHQAPPPQARQAQEQQPPQQHHHHQQQHHQQQQQYQQQQYQQQQQQQQYQHYEQPQAQAQAAAQYQQPPMQHPPPVQLQPLPPSPLQGLPPARAYPGENDDTTVVRADVSRTPSPPRIDVRPASRVSSRPAQSLPDSQPRVQVALSTRMRSIDGPRSSLPPPHSAPIASVDDVPASPSSVFDNATEVAAVRAQPISAENRRPSTVGRGNARILEALPHMPRLTDQAQPPASSALTEVQAPVPQVQPPPSWVTATDIAADPLADKDTRVEPNPHLNPPPAPPRPATVTVGNSAIGVRSKKVVPLDDTRKR